MWYINSMCASELPHQYMAFFFVNICLLILSDTGIYAMMLIITLRGTSNATLTFLDITQKSIDRSS